MNHRDLQDQRPAPELSRLNETERRVLTLLAEGHTAKSVANLIGSTPAAVNERLREARRKTGVGSSRELARTLKALENRDSEIGIASSIAMAATAPVSGVRSGRPSLGVAAMIGFGIIAIGGAAAWLAHAPQTIDPIDPIIGVPIPNSDPSVAYRQVRSETRDPQWASHAEAILRARFSRVSYVGGPGSILRVKCATKICEVAGTINAPEKKSDDSDPHTAKYSADGYGANAPLSVSMRELQGKSLHDDMKKAGLDDLGGLFTSTKSKPEHMAFFLYFARASH